MLYNGEYTLQNVETGEHRTFKIYTQSKESSFAPGQRILCLLNGSNNEADYQRFAFVKDDKICVWNKFRGKDGRKSGFEYYAALFEQLIIDETINEDVQTDIYFLKKIYHVLLSKRCIKCNHKLTTPDSIKAGIGPVCASM